VIEVAADGRTIKDQDLRNVLAMMLFRGDDVYKLVGLLSGGERARLRLAQLLLDKPNVLVLDEPTNHLDIPSREALEGALQGFPGTILCVSHDRYFLDQVAARLLVLRPPELMDFAGTYTAWHGRLENEKQKPGESAKSRPKATPGKESSQKKKDNPYLRPFGRLSLKELEQQIADTEVAVAECQQSFGDPDLSRDPARGKRLQAEFKALSKKLEALEAEYFARET
jgi:ATP-binding cassette subfamily F protein 3